MINPPQKQGSSRTSESAEDDEDSLEYSKGYRAGQIMKSEDLVEKLTERSQSTSDFIWRAVVITLLIIMMLAAVATIIAIFLGGRVELTILVGIFGSAAATLLALLVPSPLDTLSRTVNSIIRYWRERRDTDIERVKQAEERATEAESDRRTAEYAREQERTKGIKIAADLMGRIHEARAAGKDAIAIDDLDRIVVDTFPEFKPPEKATEQGGKP